MKRSRLTWLLLVLLAGLLVACGNNSTPTTAPITSASPVEAEATATPVVLSKLPPQTQTPAATSGKATAPAATSLPSRTPDSQELETIADEYFNSGDYTRAADAYQQLLQANPNKYQLLLKLALAQLADGRETEAIANLEKAAKADPKNPEPLFYLGRIYGAHQDFAKAEGYLEQASQLKPDNAEIKFYLAEAYYSDKKLDKAEAAYREVVRLEPDVPDGHARLGLILFQLGKYEESEKEYLETIKLSPQEAGTYNNLAYLYIELGRFDEARQPIQTAEKLGLGGQDYFEATKLGLLIPDGQKEETAGNLDKAADDYTKAAKADNTLGYYYLGKLEQSRNKLDEAATAFKNYIKDGRLDNLKQDAQARLKQMGKA